MSVVIKGMEMQEIATFAHCRIGTNLMSLLGAKLKSDSSAKKSLTKLVDRSFAH